MKKILSAFAVAAVTATVQAASLNWAIATVYEPGTDTLANGYSAYLFITEQANDYGAKVTTVDEIESLIQSKGSLSDYIAAQVAISNGRQAVSATGYNGNNFANGDSLSGFAVIFNATDYSEATGYFVTAEKSASWTSGTGAKSLAFGAQTATKNATAWTAVPEPATAALALLGLGLMIKRRKA
ncbi:MAG: PEP-CTERM sorting domain-containing protein [Kiritimatiellae bacterium]|nr:PEP-CTERM sorting domain-containing protein [Kiritimatiellia bacterium]